MSGCQLLPEKTLEVHTKYVYAEPALLEKPKAPPISSDPVVTITQVEADYYGEACEAFKDNPEADYPGLDISICNWVIMGFTVQGWYNLQQNLLLIQNYVEQMEQQRDFYEKQLKNRHDAQN